MKGILYNDDCRLAVRFFANDRCCILPQNLCNYRTGENDGSARVGFEELRRACGWKSLRCSPLGMRLANLLWEGYSLGGRRAFETVYSHTIIC